MSALGVTPDEEDGVSQEIGVGDVKVGLGGGMFEVVLSEVFEEDQDVVDVKSGVEIDHDDVIEVGGIPFKVIDDLVDDLSTPRG